VARVGIARSGAALIVLLISWLGLATPVLVTDAHASLLASCTYDGLPTTIAMPWQSSRQTSVALDGRAVSAVATNGYDDHRQLPCSGRRPGQGFESVAAGTWRSPGHFASSSRTHVAAETGAAAETTAGDLTAAETRQIQSVVNRAGRPVDVVGSVAGGARGPGSDIDYTAATASPSHFEPFLDELPGMDSHGLLHGTPDLGRRLSASSRKAMYGHE